jgi:NADPH:quinone reductase-like Zn-dependent oxidoreductase
MLFDRLGIVPGKTPNNKTLLIIGASGGVGSIMTQLATRLTSLTVIGTASRPETQAWVKELGAHHVIDHSRPIAEELKRIGIPAVDYIVSLTQTDSHLAQIAEAIAPQGKFGLIDDPVNFDITLFKRKSASIHWELMFTRPLFGTPDMVGTAADIVDSGAQHRLLRPICGKRTLIESRGGRLCLRGGFKAFGRFLLRPLRFFLRAAGRGLPGGNSLSFASPKESKQRKGDPTCCVPSLRYGQPAVLGSGGVSLNSLRSNRRDP